MKRREFIGLVGGAAAWPLLGRAQQSAMPVIGFLRNTSAASSAPLVSAFRQGLAELGYMEGQNVAIEYRWAEGGDLDELTALAADLVRREVAVIVAAGGTPSALAAKRATNTIPIVFEMGGDPIRLGLVASLNRPGGNATGIVLFVNESGTKRIDLLLKLVPTATTFAILLDPRSLLAGSEIAQARQAAHAFGRQTHVLNASSEAEITAAFATLVQLKIESLVVVANPLFVGRRDQLVALAARYGVPAAYAFRDFATAGGLMSYGDSLVDAFRQTGVYTGRVLKGAKPADLPVIQPTKFEFVINLRTAKALGLAVPPSLLAIADEVIE